MWCISSTLYYFTHFKYDIYHGNINNHDLFICSANDWYISFPYKKWTFAWFNIIHHSRRQLNFWYNYGLQPYEHHHGILCLHSLWLYLAGAPYSLFYWSKYQPHSLLKLFLRVWARRYEHLKGINWNDLVHCWSINDSQW